MKTFTFYPLISFITSSGLTVSASSNSAWVSQLEFHDCNSTQQTVINDAWSSALELVQSVGKVNASDPLAIDWWGPPSINNEWFSRIEEQYWKVAEALLFASNKTGPNVTQPKVFCGDPPGKNECTKFADADLAHKDPFSGFYSYRIDGKNSTSDLSLVICDTFFNEQFNLRIEYFWMRHASEILRQILTAPSIADSPYGRIQDGWISARAINTTVTGHSDLKSVLLEGYSLSSWAPDVAMGLARSRFVCSGGINYRPIQNPANYLGYALTNYARLNDPDPPFIKSVNGLIGGSEFCELGFDWYMCSPVVLSDSGAIWNAKYIASERFQSRETISSFLERPGKATAIPLWGDESKCWEWLPDKVYPQHYLEYLDNGRRVGGHKFLDLAAGYQMEIPGSVNTTCSNSTSPSISLSDVYDGIDRFCKVDGTLTRPWKKTIGHVAFEINAKIHAYGSEQPYHLCSIRQCSAALYQAMTRCSQSAKALTGGGGSVNVGCSGWVNNFEWSLRDITS